MRNITDQIFASAPIGAVTEPPRAGTALENIFVYDAVARDIKARASNGCAEITEERVVLAGDEEVIAQLSFRRLW
jgi:hypothetical protein